MNYLGLLVEIIYIFIIISISTLLLNKKIVSIEGSRKFIHIGLCNTYLIIWMFFDNVIFASLLPFLFIIINYYSHNHKTIKAMERDDDSLGTVWYALSLFILIAILFYSKSNIYIGALAILILGYSDGFAGLIGKKFGKHKFSNGKSLEGSLTFYIISFIVSYIILKLNSFDNILIYSFIISSYATTIEVICTKGFDNLFLPLAIALITYLLTINNLFFTFSLSLSINLVVALTINGLKLLNLKGAIAAIILGTTVHYIAGNPAYICLITYFILSNLLGLLKRNETKKREKRGMKQVICNGIISLGSIILYGINKNDLFLAIYLIALTSSCSDTFGGDLGKTSNKKVQYILSRKEVPKGISGGITTKGLIGSLISSFLMALFSFILFKENKLFLFVTIAILGFISSIIDSIMREVIQVKYEDKKTHEIVEKIDSKNKDNYIKISGFEWIGNSTVNLLSIIVISIIFAIIYYLFYPNL